ncbi:MAG: carboxylating nicotinate-nucleotide diphosphorylase [Pirellulaceae bacterium]|nr:carboxylating nicotinate-nucleotide diphosphorylase [Planctomycetales bacterium]
MPTEFPSIDWSTKVAADCRDLVGLSIREDLGRQHDWTTVALVPAGTPGSACIVSRTAGVVAGLTAIPTILDAIEAKVQWTPQTNDGDLISAQQSLGRLTGDVRQILTAERTILNILGRLSGVATLTRRFVDAVSHTPVRIYDTRKTTPGWRSLEKYAVHCGGGFNHRLSLASAIMIKDNHLAAAANTPWNTIPLAIQRVREFVEHNVPDPRTIVIELEVDSLEQLTDALHAQPDIVLLDNMSTETLRQAVQLRNQLAPNVVLEASGGVTLDTVAAIAETGVDRISVGAVTHSAVNHDIALDWDFAHAYR